MTEIKFNVLIVEDEQPMLEAIKVKLESNSFAVATARTVEQALDYLDSGVKVDAIWLDHYLLGQKDGLALLAQLKENEGEWKAIPVFVVSNTAGADTVQAYLRLGIEKYFTKSDHRLDEIVADIADYLQSERD